MSNLENFIKTARWSMNLTCNQSDFSLKPDNARKFVNIWWNVSRRLILLNISSISTFNPDIVFVLETSIGYDALPKTSKITNYSPIKASAI